MPAIGWRTPPKAFAPGPSLVKVFKIVSNLNSLNAGQMQILKERRERLREGFIQLMQDRMFDAAVSRGTGDIKKIIYRFECVEELIKEVLH